MSIEVGGQRIPMYWRRLDGESIPPGLTLTQFAALDGGMIELIRLSRWCLKSNAFALFGETIATALRQDHLSAPVAVAKAALNKHGARRGRAKAAEQSRAHVQAERMVEYGLF